MAANIIYFSRHLLKVNSERGGVGGCHTCGCAGDPLEQIALAGGKIVPKSGTAGCGPDVRRETIEFAAKFVKFHNF